VTDEPRLRVVRLLPELDFGGVESRIELQARLHDKSRYELRVCAFHRGGAAAARVRSAGVPVDVLEVSPNPRNPRAALALLRYLRRSRPDVLHASIAEANFHGIIAGRLARVPVVIAEETGMPAHRPRAVAAYALLYWLADAVVGVTQAVCDYVIEVDRAQAAKVRRVYNCARPEFFPEPRLEVPSGNGAEFVFLAVGRLTPVKNHVTLLRAFAVLIEREPRARLVIAGDGPLREQTQRWVNELGLQERVRLLGYSAGVSELLGRAGAFVLPSLSEGCSVSLIEALASAVPALGSDVAGIREVLGPLAASWTAPATDVEAWVKLMARAMHLDPEARLELGRRGQQLAYERFSPTAYLASLEGLYRELWAARGSRREHAAEQVS
jgi:glycosyltransferase involved in cell wall biosynthesis